MVNQETFFFLHFDEENFFFVLSGVFIPLGTWQLQWKADGKIELPLEQSEKEECFFSQS